MSTPQSLLIPAGVTAQTVHTDRGAFAAHTATPTGDLRGHVLLVPGWTGSKEDFTPILPLLSAAGFAVTAYDQRGQFETPGTPDDDYSLAALAVDAIAVAEAAAGTDRGSHLLGHSFGGLVAQRAVVGHPDRWTSLSLLSSGPGALMSSPTRPLERLMEAIGTVPLADIHEARERAVLDGPDPRPSDITEFLARRFTANSPDALRAMTQHLLSAPDAIEEVRAVGLPVWVGRGADDDAWPHEQQDDMAARLGTHVHVIDPAAHSPAVENPIGLMAAWRPFLEVPA
ncbi:alpha/beta fold hydrolase [Aeromicrobium sp. CF3.5]|uniref:alpha/beta fold hydrolase n=1 Tax=Aeromicrobium sp. CF3.5 TaxID=3373078 RepID=UPI003EE45D47